MDANKLKQLLEQIAEGKLSPAAAMDELRSLPFAELSVAKFDTHRPLRNGFSEVILCEGKRREHVLAIVTEALERGHNVFGTRADEALLEEVKNRFSTADTDTLSRTFTIMKRTPEFLHGQLAIVAAGTADMPVAEEARRTAQFFGIEAARFYDVGVAGLPRLISCMDKIREADVVVAVAGMEGALPSVLGGLLSAPIIAVPTSVGYGANFKGVAALLGMLTSCSEGISVVNIDNGFGAACAAIRIFRLAERTNRGRP